VLGASTLALGAPVAFVLALVAWTRGVRGPQAVVALSLSAIEALVLATVVALALSGLVG